MRYLLPESVNDFLFDDLKKKHALENIVRRLFSLWGYDELLPAGLDFYDNFAGGVGARPQTDMLKSFDGNGQILVMRPEFTAQIARLVGTKLGDARPPLRLCYLGNVYENPRHGEAGRLAEFTQAGVELMGEGRPAADAEVCMLALSCMKECGLTGYMLELGQVDFFKGLMEEAGVPEALIPELQRYVEQKNALAIELLLKSMQLSLGATERIMELPMLFGGHEVLAKARKISGHPRCVAAIENIESVYELLCGCGLGEYISIDLGLVHQLSYYTGVVFRGIAASFGRPLLTGGRYDTLLAEYGRPMPATGFALGVENVLAAVSTDEGEPGDGIDVLYAIDENSFESAWKKVEALREQGLRVELCYETRDDALGVIAKNRRAKSVVKAWEVEQ